MYDYICVAACRLSRSRVGCGFFVADDESHITARECKLQDNGNCGAFVTCGGKLTMHLCEVVEHTHGAGAVVHGQGSRVDLQESTIVGCRTVGLVALNGGRADCNRVGISFVTEHGVEVRPANFT